MKTTRNEAVAQGASAWYEQQEHEQIMKDLDSVQGCMTECSCGYGHGSHWTVKKLELTKLRKIMFRNNKSEILHMINRYGQAAAPERFTYGCDACHKTPTTDNILPDEIQRQIALRNDTDEMEAFLSYQGFCPIGQDVILDRNNHDEIMRYISRYGFALNQQRRLKARSNRDEMCLHILKHGLAAELLDEMFDNIEHGGDLSEYYDFIKLRELPIPHQSRMLKVVKTPEFRAYVSRYGLWENVHDDLVKYRSEDDLAYYLTLHNYLKSSAEKTLARDKSHSLKMLYISRYPFALNSFFGELLSCDNLDYEAISACIPKLDFQKGVRLIFCSYDNKTEDEDIKLIRFGNTEDIMARIKENKLTLKALVYLFYRDNPKELKTYMQEWGKPRKPQRSDSSCGSFNYDIGEDAISSREYTTYL